MYLDSEVLLDTALAVASNRWSMRIALKDDCSGF